MNNITNTQCDNLADTDPAHPNDIDLIDSAEVYNKNNNGSGYCYSYYYTLQQSTTPKESDNVSVAPAAHFPSGPTAPPLKEEKKKEKEKAKKNWIRKVSTEDHYINISVSVNNIRRGTRTDRCVSYISLQDENEKKYNVFLRSSLTTSIDETRRSLTKTDNRVLLAVYQKIVDNRPDDAKLMMGRLRYNPRQYKIEDEHKTNLKSGLLGIYDYGSHMTAVLFLLGEWYAIELGDDMTITQKKVYDFLGVYSKDMGEEE